MPAGKLTWRERNWEVWDCFDSRGQRVGSIARDTRYRGPNTWGATDCRERPHTFLGEFLTESLAKSAVEAAVRRASRKEKRRK